MPDRAIIFIDGSNWYHGLKNAGITELARLDYAKISRKLIGPRDWRATRYYIGQVKQKANTQLYADQRAFLSSLEKTDGRISVHLGRLEPRPTSDPGAEELARYLAGLRTRIDRDVYQDLVGIAKRNRRVEVYVEKAVDVMIAVDMTLLATRDAYDAAYLLSADGDLTAAVDAVRQLRKKVYVASVQYGAQIAAVATTFIHLTPDWFKHCR